MAFEFSNTQRPRTRLPGKIFRTRALKIQVLGKSKKTKNQNSCRKGRSKNKD